MNYRFLTMKQHTQSALRLIPSGVVIASLLACSPGASPTQPQTQSSTQNSTQSAAQTTSLSGKMVLPYAVSDGMRTQSLIRSQADIRAFRATVDSRPVSLQVNAIVSTGSETQIDYTMTDLPSPVAGRVYAVEVASAHDEPLLGAAVNLQLGQSNALTINTHSTAVLIQARKKYGSLVNINTTQLREVETDPALVNVELSVGSVLRGVGSLTRDILSGVGQLVTGILDSVFDRRRN